MIRTPDEIACKECGHAFPAHLQQCPHCCRPSAHFPNVTAAEDPAESAALEARYAQAAAKARESACEGAFQDFESAVATRSRAVIARSLLLVWKLASSDRELWATYHKERAADLRMPDTGGWGVFRTACEAALFPGYKESIQFGALSLDGIGVRKYGECSVVLRDEFIAHRASVFEETNVLFALACNLTVADLTDLPKGYRATWAGRGRLAATKLVDQLEPDTPETEYPGLLLHQGATSAQDSFVEVHVFGSLTARAVEKVTVTGPEKARRQQRAILRALESTLQQYGASLEEAL